MIQHTFKKLFPWEYIALTLITLLLLSNNSTTKAAIFPEIDAQKIDIGLYLGGAQFISEYVVSTGFDWAKYSEYDTATEPSVGIYGRYTILDWLKGEVSYSYASLSGSGAIPEYPNYNFKTNIHEVCLSGVVNVIPLLTHNSLDKWQVNGKLGIGWAHISPSEGYCTENKPYVKVLIPIGGSIGYSIGRRGDYTVSLGYDFRMIYTDQINQYPDRQDIKEIVSKDLFYTWGGYGVCKLGIECKLSSFKKKRPGSAWLNKLGYYNI